MSSFKERREQRLRQIGLHRDQEIESADAGESGQYEAETTEVVLSLEEQVDETLRAVKEDVDREVAEQKRALEEVAIARALVQEMQTAAPLHARQYDHRVPKDDRRAQVNPPVHGMIRAFAETGDAAGWAEAGEAAGLPRTVQGRVLESHGPDSMLMLRWPVLRRRVRMAEAEAVAVMVHRTVSGVKNARAHLVAEVPDGCVLSLTIADPVVAPASIMSAPGMARLLWVQRARQVFTSVGLAESVSATRADGTRYTKRRAPRVLPEVRDSDDGPVLVVEPLPGQTLATWQRAESALGMQIGLPSMRVSLDGTGTRVLLHACTVTPSWPRLVVPEPDSLLRVRSIAEAVVGYPDLAIPVGRTVDGQDISVRLVECIHALVAGGSGSGKTRTLLSWLSVLMAGGADVVIIDGKGETDYEPLFRSGVPGIRLLARTTGEILRAVAWVHDEMIARQDRTRRLKQHGVRGHAERPLVVVFDEFAAFKTDMRQRTQSDYSHFSAMVGNLLRKGRSQRVHMIFASQSVYDDAFPLSWMSNIRLRLWLGASGMPTDMKNFAGGETGGQVALREAAKITDDMRGRGIMMKAKDDSPEALTAVQFQAPYGYTPDWDPVKESPSDEVIQAWKEFQTEWERVPRFAPRLAVDFTATDGVEVDRGYVKVGKDGSIQPTTAPGGGDEDWAQWSLKELAQLPMRALDTENGPIPDRRNLDPTSPYYSGDTSMVGKGHSNPGWENEID